MAWAGQSKPTAGYRPGEGARIDLSPTAGVRSLTDRVAGLFRRGGAQAQRGSAVHLSHILKTAHFAALGLLIAVTAGVAVWISQEYTRLARDSGKALVAASVQTFEERVKTLLSDYSNWDEAYEAAHAGDIGWLYRNLGTGATETQWADGVIITGETAEGHFGWTADGGEEAQTGILPDALVSELLALVRDGPLSRETIATSYGWLDGEFWIFAINRFLPYDPSPIAATPGFEHKFQIHALKIDEGVLEELEQQTLISGFALVPDSADNDYWLALRDHDGATVAKLAWDLPDPGWRILGKIGLPLTLSLLIVVAVAILLSRLAVSSAERLELALDSALAADRAKSQFLANVGHELRTPMNAVIGLTGVLKASDLDDEKRELVGTLSDAAESHMELLDKILDFSQLETGNWNLQFKAFDMRQLVDAATRALRLAAERKGLALHVEHGPRCGDCEVLGDPVAVRQIVTNLVQNAIKFTEEGSVTVTTGCAIGLDEVEYVISVRDTGMGIARRDQRRIFERFSRVSSDIGAPTSGTGLGLAISSSLAELMGGRLEMDSEPDRGSTFTFRARFELAPAGSTDRGDGPAGRPSGTLHSPKEAAP